MRPADSGQLATDVLVAHAHQFGQVLDAVAVKRKTISDCVGRGLPHGGALPLRCSALTLSVTPSTACANGV